MHFFSFRLNDMKIGVSKVLVFFSVIIICSCDDGSKEREYIQKMEDLSFREKNLLESTKELGFSQAAVRSMKEHIEEEQLVALAQLREKEDVFADKVKKHLQNENALIVFEQSLNDEKRKVDEKLTQAIESNAMAEKMFQKVKLFQAKADREFELAREAKARATAKQEEFNSLVERYKMATKNISHLQNQLSGLNYKYQDILECYSSLEKKHESLKRDKGRLLKDYDSVVYELRDLKSKLTKIKKGGDHKESEYLHKISKLKKGNEVLSSQLNSSKASNQRQLNEIKVKGQRIRELEKVVADMRSKKLKK